MMQITLADLFLSTEVWGLFGVFCVVAVGFVINANKKYKGLLIFWIMVQSVMIAMYYDLALVTPFYWWNFFILVIGFVAVGFTNISR